MAKSSYKITVNPLSPALSIKELGGYQRDRDATHKGNLTLEQIKKKAKTV